MINIRLATLDDTQAITEVHKTDVKEWLRYDSRGQPVATPYEELTIFERWQHGGPWMSVETCAIHINKLLAGAGVPLVAEVGGRVWAEAEVYEGVEPPPFGRHLNLSILYTHKDYQGQDLGSALLNYIMEMGRAMGCERLTVAHAEAASFYAQHNLRHTASGRRVLLPAQAGRVVYQATPFTEDNPDQIRGWYMPLGRYQNARQEWEHLFPERWAAGLPKLLEPRTAHLQFSVSGQKALVYMQEADQPDQVSVACWSPRPLSQPLLTAIRDRACRDGYKTIVTYAMQSEIPALGPDAEPTDYQQVLYEISLSR